MAAWFKAERRSGAAESERLARWLSALPAGDPFAALGHISTRLAELRTRGRGRPDLREEIAVLEPAARGYYREATRRYLRERRESPAEQLSVRWETVDGALAGLMHAQLSLVVPWSAVGKRAGLPSSGLAPELARAVRACAAVLKWTWLRPSLERPGMWADLCRLYALAERHACSREAVPVWPGGDRESTVEREFLKTCMLATTDPAKLSADQIDIAERVVEFCAPGFSLSSASQSRLPFAIDIEGGEAPRAREVEPTAGHSVRTIGMEDQRLLATLIRLVEADRITPRTLGVGVDRSTVMMTLQHLAHCWSAPAAQSGDDDATLDEKPQATPDTLASS